MIFKHATLLGHVHLANTRVWALSEVPSGLTLGFQGYGGASLLTKVHRHGNIGCRPNLLRLRLR